MELLGNIFHALMKLGGGSELLPLLVFSVLLVLLGLGLGTLIMRLIRPAKRDTPSDAEQPG